MTDDDTEASTIHTPLSRRRFILAGASAISVTFTGCVGGQGPDTPEEVVEAYYDALDEGDIDRVRELTHDERPDPISDQDIAQWGATGMEVNKIELLEESDDVAVLETIIVVQTPRGNRVVTNEYELRKQDEEWRIYRTERVGVQ
jgi:ketosteroid isomerase-like protein